MDDKERLALWADLNQARHLIEKVMVILVEPQELFPDKPGCDRLDDSSKDG